MTTYTAVFEQTESGTWSGHVPDLPAILAVGKTKQELETNMREAISIWIEEMLEEGFPIPAPAFCTVPIEVAA